MDRARETRESAIRFADRGSGQLAAHAVEGNSIKENYWKTLLSMAGIHATSGKKFESNGPSPSENNAALISNALILPPFA